MMGILDRLDHLGLSLSYVSDNNIHARGRCCLVDSLLGPELCQLLLLLLHGVV